MTLSSALLHVQGAISADAKQADVLALHLSGNRRRAALILLQHSFFTICQIFEGNFGSARPFHFKLVGHCDSCLKFLLASFGSCASESTTSIEQIESHGAKPYRNRRVMCFLYGIDFL